MVRSDSGSEKIAGPSRPRARPNAAADKMILEQRLDLRYAPADFPTGLSAIRSFWRRFAYETRQHLLDFFPGSLSASSIPAYKKYASTRPRPRPLCERLRVDESLRFDKGPDIRRDWRVFVQASSRI
jgi:hypothetical protein